MFLLIALYSTLKAVWLHSLLDFSNAMTKMIFITGNSVMIPTPLSWDHSCLSGSEQDKMCIFSSFAWWLLEKFVCYLFLIYHKINKTQKSMNYNLTRALTTRFQCLSCQDQLQSMNVLPLFTAPLSLKSLHFYQRLLQSWLPWWYFFFFGCTTEHAGF